jgi:hypothetical protein
MKPCALALFEGIIDYAGLFPPAALSMEDAFSRYLVHRQSGDGWMLARFVCPAGRLAELEDLLTDAAVEASKIEVAVLGRGGATLEDFVKATDEDAALIRTFLSRQGERATADVFEVRLPEAGGAAVAVVKAWRSLTENGSTAMTPFFEVSLLGDWRPRLPAAAAAIRDATRKAGGSHRLGLKIRCGGLDAAAIPEPMAVAAAIATCRNTGVPLKATQGLHHPFRHTDETLGAVVHGFLNLFTAGVLAHAHDLPVTRLTEVIADTDPQSFVVEADRLAWHDLEASAAEVAAARSGVLTTFGSCSFSGPRDDLEALAIIDPAKELSS